LSVHIKKRYWIAEGDLKKSAKVFVVGAILFPIPLISMAVMSIGGVMAVHSFYSLLNDLEYIDYVLRVED